MKTRDHAIDLNPSDDPMARRVDDLEAISKGITSLNMYFYSKDDKE